MWIDGNNVLAGSVSVDNKVFGQSVNGAGSILSANVIDTAAGVGNQLAAVGAGRRIDVTVTVVTAPTAGTSVQFQTVQADDPLLSVNVQVLNETDAYPIAALPVGASFPVSVGPAAPFAPKRYVGLRFVNVGPIDTASYFAAVGETRQSVKNMAFRSGYSVV